MSSEPTPEQLAKYRSVNEALVRAVPELKERYEHETAEWGEEMGSHVIYGTILNPYLERLLAADDEDKEALKRIFDFLEEIASDPDPYVSEVATTTVAECLEETEDRLNRARPYLGPVMAQYARTRLPYRLPRRLRKRDISELERPT
jgi:hypothetical protein